jgi:hypothetical protein
MLAEEMRAQAIRGEGIDLGDLIRLEGAARRAVADLRLPVVEHGEKDAGLSDYLQRAYGQPDGDNAEQADEALETGVAPSGETRTSGRRSRSGKHRAGRGAA